ncbi:MAG: Crp/Fnr family transcriptional regulator [Bacteroidaceae bacterium]|nr:Crp/Fnr family transcriptional regulator [Bacteroidaceae bacterium]
MISLTQKYELLTKLPLLQGISGKELAHIENMTGMEINEVPAMKRPLIRQNDPCTHLVFLTTGKMMREYTSHDGRFQTKSVLQAPTLLEPYNLYGLNCKFRCSYTPLENVSVITVKKTDVQQHLMKTEIFRINYFNLLSAIIHKKDMLLRPCRHLTVKEKILQFILKLFPDCESQAEIAIKMTDLAEYIDETRLNTSRALNQLEKAGLMELKRSLIVIPDIKKIHKS